VDQGNLSSLSSPSRVHDYICYDWKEYSWASSGH